MAQWPLSAVSSDVILQLVGVYSGEGTQVAGEQLHHSLFPEYRAGTRYPPGREEPAAVSCLPVIIGC